MSGERQGQQAGVQGAAAAPRPQSSLPGPLLHFESENSEGLRLRREGAAPSVRLPAGSRRVRAACGWLRLSAPGWAPWGWSCGSQHLPQWEKETRGQMDSGSSSLLGTSAGVPSSLAGANEHPSWRVQPSHFIAGETCAPTCMSQSLDQGARNPKEKSHSAPRPRPGPSGEGFLNLGTADVWTR